MTPILEVYVVHGLYAPEPYIEGVYFSPEDAQKAIDEQEEPDRFELVRQRVR